MLEYTMIKTNFQSGDNTWVDYAFGHWRSKVEINLLTSNSNYISIYTYTHARTCTTPSPVASHHTSDADTASLQATTTQLQSDKANYESKQQEIQAQINSLQISVSILKTSSNITPTEPPLSITHTVNSFTKLVSLLKSVICS